MSRKSSTSDTLPSELSELPPSAKLVYKTLEYEGELTQKMIAEETALNQRTVRYAIDQLEQIEAITSRISFRDARQDVYKIRESIKDSVD